MSADHDYHLSNKIYQRGTMIAFCLKHLGFRSFLLLLIMTSLLKAENSWRKISYPYLTIISKASDNEIKGLAKQFMVFVIMMKEVVPVDTRMLPPLTIVLFDKNSELTTYKPVKPNGKTARWVGGFFCSFDTWSIIGMPTNFDNAETHRTIFHEGVHWYLSAAHKKYPLWFEEGMAEVFSTFEYNRDKISWGHTNDDYINWLTDETPQPIDVFINIQRDDKIFNSDYPAGKYYAEAWAFVHYLLFNNTDGSFPKTKKIRDSLQTINIQKTFSDLTSEQLAQIETEFRSYIMRGSISHSEQKDVSITDTTNLIVTASELDVQTALAQLSIGAQKFTMARSIAETLIKKYPESPNGYDLLSFINQKDLQLDSVRIYAEKAVAAGSKNDQTYFFLANTRWNDSIAMTPDKAREIADLYKKSIANYPYYRSAYSNLSRILFNTRDKCNKDDLFVLKRAREIFPDEPEILLGNAIVLRFTGEKNDVYSLIKQAQNLTIPLSDEGGKFAEVIQTDFLTSDISAKINSLLSKNNVTAAIALLDELIKKDEYPFLKTRFISWKNDLIQLKKR